MFKLILLVTQYTAVHMYQVVCGRVVDCSTINEAKSFIVLFTSALNDVRVTKSATSVTRECLWVRPLPSRSVTMGIRLNIH